MNHKADEKLLAQYLNQADKAAEWLKRSYLKSKKFNISSSPTETEFDTLENLSSRFARLNDILFQKIFRNLDKIELETSGSIIDVLNRAAKRGIIKSDRVARELRELRNTIAHEYTEENLIQLFEQILNLTPELLSIYGSLREYTKNKYSI